MFPSPPLSKVSSVSCVLVVWRVNDSFFYYFLSLVMERSTNDDGGDDDDDPDNWRQLVSIRLLKTHTKGGKKK
ncbi:MAG: hypothetical protein Q8J97_04460, partial [Flavobacteriaceae bacterium]|nr:hypothetical protein [Flavobacteriaceae bacterium]